MRSFIAIIIALVCVFAPELVEAATRAAPDLPAEGAGWLGRLAMLLGTGGLFALGQTNMTGTIKHTFSTGSSDVPPFALGGGETEFYLGSCKTDSGGLAYKLPCIEMLIRGVFHQAGGAGVRVFWDNFVRAIVANVEIRNTFNGTIMASRNILGAYLPIIDFVSNGMRPGSRFRGSFPAAPGDYPFAYRTRIPLDHRVISKAHHLAPLTALLRNSYLVLNWALPAVIAAISPGSTIDGLTVRATGKLLPESEITVGPAHEWVDYQVIASSGNVLTIKGWGSATGFSGVETPAAIDTALLLTSVNGLGGAFTADTLIQYGFETRAQQTINDIASMYTDVFDADDLRTIGSLADQGTASLTDWTGYPYALASAAGVPFDPANATAENQAAALFFPLIHPGGRESVELTKIQQFPGADEDVQLTFSVPPVGTHHILTHQIKRFTPAKLEEIRQQIINAGVAKRVLGTDNVDWEVKLKNKQAPGDLTAKKLTYLPHRLVPVGA
jgi:hypothetical protein